MNALVPLQRWTRDDWTALVSVKDPSGTAINLTGYTLGAEFTLAGYKVFSDLSIANGGIVMVSVTGGQFRFKVPRQLTSDALSDHGLAPVADATRIRLYWYDTNLERTSLGIIPFQVFDGSEETTVDGAPSVQIVYQNASFIIQVAASQGPAGPSSIAASQIIDATDIGRQIITASNAAVIRAALGLPATGGRKINDVSAFGTAADVYVGYDQLTAPRQFTLPPANPYVLGQPLIIADETGNCSEANTITIAADGTDTIAGQPTITMNSARQKIVLHSNGVNLWLL